MKAKEAKITSDRILYDSTQPQTFGFTLSQKGRQIPITHTIQPVSDARFFQMSEEIEAIAAKIKKLDTSMYRPKEKIWEEHVHEATGYPENWKERVSLDDRIGVVNAYFEVNPDDEPDATEDGPLVYDFDALVEVYFYCRFGGAQLMGMCHKFREITREDKDEFLAIISNEPDDKVLASATKISKNERLHRLGKKLLKETEGYAPGTEVPAWHLCATTEWFFLREQARQGK
jgi:hypothetical protein